MKDDIIRFRCSKQLKEQIEAAASEAGKSISEYVTDLIKEDLFKKTVQK